MELRIIPVLLFSLIGLITCSDYGDFTIAERKDLLPEETPPLEEMNLLDINIDFHVFTEAHYHWLPEDTWPKDIQDYISESRRRFNNEWERISELPEEFSLGLPEGCMLVEPMEQSSWYAQLSKYKRLSLNNREVTLISYPTPATDTRPSWSVGPPHFAVFEADKSEPSILEIESYSYEFEAFAHNDQILMILNAEDRLLYRTLSWSEGQPRLSDPIVLFQMEMSSDRDRAGIQNIVATKADKTIHLAWLVNDSGSSIYHMTIDPSQPEISQPSVVTETDSSLLGINAHSSSVWLHWIDGRFGREGFNPTNMRKWFSAKFSQSGDLIETLVINTPFDHSDSASSPVFVWSYDSFEVLAWGVAMQEISRINRRPIQFSLLNTETHTVSLAEDRLSYDQIIEEAQRQYTVRLRSQLSHGISPEEAEDCDRWVAWLRQREEVNANLNQNIITTDSIR